MRTPRPTPHARPRPLALLLALALAALLTACGSDTTAEPDATGDGTDTGMEEMEDDHDGESFAFGEPADAGEADRTVAVEALDTFAFEPASVDVAADEVITFEVTNAGQIPHEFVLGPEGVQQEHAEEMAEMEESEMMHDEPNAIEVPPGETASITWHFTEAGEVLFGCHEPGHYDAGMVGTITVE